MQLVAYGAQDVYLTGNPKVTFFQAVYKRHTNFAMENIEQTVNGTPGADGRVSVTVVDRSEPKMGTIHGRGNRNTGFRSMCIVFRKRRLNLNSGKTFRVEVRPTGT